MCFCSCTCRLPDRCLRFTDGFFQGSLKVICGLQGLRFLYSGFSLQHVTWEVVSGGLLLHPGNLPLPEVRGLPQPIGGWWCRAWGNGSRDSGEGGEHALGAQGFEQPTFGTLENGTNERTDSGEEAAQETFCLFSPIACRSLHTSVPPGPFFLLRRQFHVQVNNTFGLCGCGHEVSYCGWIYVHQASRCLFSQHHPFLGQLFILGSHISLPILREEALPGLL